MSAFDHSYFPHILEAILDYSSTEALLNFRGCSRELLDKADARLFDHVTLSPRYNDANTLVVQASPFGSNLKFEVLRHENPSTSSGVAVIDPSLDGDKWRQLARQAAASAAALAQRRSRVVASVYTHNLGYFRSRVTASRLLDTARVMGWVLTECPPLWDLLARARGVQRVAVTVPGEIRVWDLYGKRATHTLHCRPNVLGSFSIMQVYEYLVQCAVGPLLSLRKATVHLLVGGPKGHTLDDFSQGGRFFAGDASHRHLDCGPQTQLTIVGGTQEFRRALGLDVKTSQEALQAHINAATSRHCPQHPGRWRQAIRLVSPQDYAREVGEVQAAMETLHNPYNQTHAVYIP